MKAMILSAGRGERLRPLTDIIPKPLVPVNGKPLIVYHLEKLAKNGFKEVIINTAYLGEKIQEALGDGEKFGLKIIYSLEKDNVLETGGGIYHALPLLGNAPFITINSDIFTDFNFADLASIKLPANIIAHLILAPNSKYHPNGDFSLDSGNSLISNNSPKPYTATGITLYHPEFFEGLQAGKYSVTPLWRQYADQGKISGSVFHGIWHDVGTLEKLKELENSSVP